MEFLKLQIAKDREEKEEFKRQIQVLSAENQKLKSRVENGEKGSRKEEHRFSTPEEQDSKPLSGLREEDTDWLRRRSSEESGGQRRPLDHHSSQRLQILRRLQIFEPPRRLRDPRGRRLKMQVRVLRSRSLARAFQRQVKPPSQRSPSSS